MDHFLSDISQWWQKKLGHGSFIVFQRLNRFYKTFLILSGLVSALSASALQFQEFHPSSTALLRAAEGFFVSSTSSAVISAMMGVMLLFKFEGYEEANRKDLLFAWSPLAVLDWSIFSFLAGILCWYTNQQPNYQSKLVGSSTGGLLLYTLWISIDMYVSIKRPGGLGSAELEYLRKQQSKQDDSGMGIDDSPDTKKEATEKLAAAVATATISRAMTT